jgi:hypothetical protein
MNRRNRISFDSFVLLVGRVGADDDGWERMMVGRMEADDGL